MEKELTNTGIAIPDYTEDCQVCNQSPTVKIVNGKGSTVFDSCLCGVCFFGTAKALDEFSWNNLD